MKRKILVPMFASMITLSLGGVANAAHATHDNTAGDTTANKSVIELQKYSELKYKIATIKDGSGIKVTKDGNVEYVANPGDKLKVIGQQGDWYNVKKDNNMDDADAAWINGRHIDISGDTGYINAGTVNMRSEASADSEIQNILAQDSTVTVLDDNGDWANVEKDGKEGFIKSKYLTDKAPEVKEEATATPAQEASNTQNTTVSQPSAVSAPVMVQAPTVVQTPVKKDVVTAPSNSNSSTTTQKPAKSASAVVALASSKLGCPYVWGAEGPNAFDCSGLTSFVYKSIGVSLPRTSSAQFGVGTSVSKANLQPGDLVFFKTGGAGVSHVGIYIGGGNMIHAPKPGENVQVSNINSAYWSSVFAGAKRVL